MKKHIAFCVLAGLTATATTAFASGYRIPEQSINSTALSGAYAANANGADTSYFNPAAMGFLAEGMQAEGNLTYINLLKTSYTDKENAGNNGDAKTEHFILPQIHVVSPAYDNFRFGFSLAYPAGLTKRWDESFAKTFAEEFTLKVIEANPTCSYTFADRYSVGIGARLIYSDGVVKSNGTIPAMTSPVTVYSTISRDLEGDTTEYGYNLAVAAMPTDNFKLAVTYRSNVDLDIEGDATLASSQGFMADGTPVATLPAGSYQGGASVSVPVPAVLTLAMAYDYGKTTLELVYDKTYWSEYEQLDFNYSAALTHPVLAAAFDAPKAKNWRDAEAYRIGLTHDLNDKVTLMGAIAYDRNPVPEDTLSFELPDSDALLFSLGGRYVVDDKLQVGAAYLYDHKYSRRVKNDTINGTFDDAGAHMLTLSARYLF